MAAGIVADRLSEFAVKVWSSSLLRSSSISVSFAGRFHGWARSRLRSNSLVNSWATLRGALYLKGHVGASVRKPALRASARCARMVLAAKAGRLELVRGCRRPKLRRRDDRRSMSARCGAKALGILTGDGWSAALRRLPTRPILTAASYCSLERLVGLPLLWWSTCMTSSSSLPSQALTLAMVLVSPGMLARAW